MNLLMAADYGNLPIIVVIMGYMACFFVLALLAILFNQFPKIISYYEELKLKKEGKVADTVKEKPTVLTADVNAAISAALTLYLTEIHDNESFHLTIRKTSKTYSPWNSKIYGLNNMYLKK